MSVESRIESALTREQEPVYGTSLTPADFAPFRSHGRAGWTVRARTAQGDEVEYMIWVEVRPADSIVDPRSAFCSTRDVSTPLGEGHVAGQRPLLDPFRRTLGEAAPVQDWYDAICMADAAAVASRRDERRWGGSGFDDVIRRVEHGISRFAQHEVAVSTFRTLSDLQAWIDEALAQTQVRVEARVLTDFAYVPGEMRDGMLLQGVVDDEVIGYVPIAVASNLDSSDWLTRPEGKTVPRPRVELRMSGAARVSLRAGFVQDWALLRAADALTADSTPNPGGWLVLGIVGTGVAIPVPAEAANLVIETDDDGAMVVVSVHPSRQREDHHRHRARFERRWGRWLDEDVHLAEEELRDGVAHAEGALRAVLAEETR